MDTQIGETFRQKVLRKAILGIFSKIFSKYFLASFRAFLGSKMASPTPIRALENRTKISSFRPRETLTGASEFPIPRIYGLWQTLMFIGFYEK